MKNKMQSTRLDDFASIEEAIVNGLAKDGGLYVPFSFPNYRIDDFYQFGSIPEFAMHLLSLFFEGSQINVNRDFCYESFSFLMPLHPLGSNVYALELFHGPTLSFKDYGARFFAQCLERLTGSKTMNVLVATSGDTGSAVASALYGLKNIRGYILFPKGKISPRQQAQITCWGDNITAISVKGSFDDCQNLVKQTIIELKHKKMLTTANSINIARLLPQMLFYAYSSIQVMKNTQMPANYIVPSGNLGNVTACYFAKKVGFPIGDILIANNANHVLSDYLDSGQYEPKASIKTLANAMDVGNPSNLERLFGMYEDFSAFKQDMNVQSVSDAQIQKAIVDCYAKYNYLICPHTATAYHRLQDVDLNRPWVLAATAHPAKFNEVIEPLLNINLALPQALSTMLNKQQNYIEIEPQLSALCALIRD